MARRRTRLGGPDFEHKRQALLSTKEAEREIIAIERSLAANKCKQALQHLEWAAYDLGNANAHKNSMAYDEVIEDRVLKLESKLSALSKELQSSSCVRK